MNKYEIKGVVGEGAYGYVLKCENKETQQIVAIKKFKEFDDNDLIRKSIQREIKMLKSFKHPNIIQLYDAFIERQNGKVPSKRKGRFFLVFEYVDRSLLEVLQATRNGMDPALIKRTIFQLLKAVEYLHSRNVVHRDIKPENILIDKDFNLKLIDFGFARPLTTQDPLTNYVATRWYRSPELLLSDQNYGKGVDLWAIGCLLCELTDGNPLFPGENQIDQLYLIQKLLGPLTINQMDMFKKRFVGMKFPDLGRAETLERRFLGKMPPKTLNLVKGLLKMDPQERFSCLDALKSSYFQDLAEAHQLIKEIEERVPMKIDVERKELKQSKSFAMPRIKQQQVPTFMNNQLLINTAYNYEIKKAISVDKFPKTQQFKQTLKSKYQLK